MKQQHMNISEPSSEHKFSELENNLKSNISPYLDPELSMLQASIALFKYLPMEVIRRIKHFANDPSAPGYLVLDDLPIGSAPATPISVCIKENRPDYVVESVALGLGSLLGEPIGYKWEKDNELVHHVIPKPGGEYTQSNQGSKVFLSFHNDMVYADELIYNQFNPDFLVLFCIRPDTKMEAETRYVDARKILNYLSKDEIERLFEPRFKMASPSNYSRFMSESGVKWSISLPILSGCEDFPEIALGANGIKATNERDQALINKVHRICNKKEVYDGVKLKSGQVLLINNRKGVHARTEFEPSRDDNERWLIRANVRQNLWSIRHKMEGGFRHYK
jgi:L-asparagine oxygenase